MIPSFSMVLLLGAVAGFTIYLGLPLALLRSRSLRTFANSLSIGILFFILIEILEKSFESAKNHLLAGFSHHEPWTTASLYAIVLVLGLAGAYLGLILFEKSWIGQDLEGARGAKAMALIIAAGIGLHNFSEGLAIGQEFASGAIALAFVLVAGFALHNATEGFGIAAPLTGERPSLQFLLLLGLIGGGPTVLGTLLGESFASPILEVFFLALAAGAIFYVVGELLHLGRLKGNHVTVALGVLTGLFLAFGSEIFIDGAHSLAVVSTAAPTMTVVANESGFFPNRVVLKANCLVHLIIRNEGKRDHEIEVKTLGLRKEIESGDSASFFITPRAAGKALLQLDPDEQKVIPYSADIVIQGSK